MNVQAQSRTNQVDPFAKLWFRLLIGFGILFTTVGLGMFVREFVFANGALSTTGVIVDIKTVESIDSTNLVPIVKFTSKSGQTARIESTSTSPAPNVGQSVSVIYHPDDLKSARIDNFVNRWLFPIIFSLIGSIAYIIGTKGALGTRQKSPNQGYIHRQ